MCRALVIMPGLICWSNNFHIIMMALKVTAGKLLRMVIIDLLLRRMKNVSSTEETLLMTYLTMGLINHALQVIFKSLNLSDSSMRALVRREVNNHPWVEMIQTNLTNSCITTMVSHVRLLFLAMKKVVDFGLITVIEQCVKKEMKLVLGVTSDPVTSDVKPTLQTI